VSYNNLLHSEKHFHNHWFEPWSRSW